MGIQRAEADEKYMENKTSAKAEGETRRNLLVGGSKKSILKSECLRFSFEVTLSCLTNTTFMSITTPVLKLSP